MKTRDVFNEGPCPFVEVSTSITQTIRRTPPEPTTTTTTTIPEPDLVVDVSTASVSHDIGDQVPGLRRGTAPTPHW